MQHSTHIEPAPFQSTACTRKDTKCGWCCRETSTFDRLPLISRCRSCVMASERNTKESHRIDWIEHARLTFPTLAMASPFDDGRTCHFTPHWKGWGELLNHILLSAEYYCNAGITSIAFGVINAAMFRFFSIEPCGCKTHLLLSCSCVASCVC